MNTTLDDLRDKYLGVKYGENVPRTKLIPSDNNASENIDWEKEEAFWMGTLEVVEPTIDDYLQPVPIVDKRGNTRPQTTDNNRVKAAGKPTPLSTSNNNGPTASLRPSNCVKAFQRVAAKTEPNTFTAPRPDSATELEKYCDQLESNRTALVRNFCALQRRVREHHGTVQYYFEAIDQMQGEVDVSKEVLTVWKKKCAATLRRKIAASQQQEAVKKNEEEMMRKPKQLREENRLLRQTLYNLEANMIKKRDELRRLKMSEGEGEYVTELKQLTEANENLDGQVLSLARERGSLQSTLEEVSASLSRHINQLIKTNAIIFDKVEVTPLRLQKDANGNKLPSPAAANDAALAKALGRAKIRQGQIGKLVGELEGTLCNFQFGKIMQNRPKTRPRTTTISKIPKRVNRTRPIREVRRRSLQDAVREREQRPGPVHTETTSSSMPSSTDVEVNVQNAKEVQPSSLTSSCASSSTYILQQPRQYFINPKEYFASRNRNLKRRRSPISIELLNA